MDRRKFLETLALASGGLAVVNSISDIGKASAKVRSRIVSPDVREIPLNLEDTPELKPIGGFYHLEVEDLERDIIVVHTGPNQYTAVDIKCKHRGCDVSYDIEDKKFVCPCHGSEYDLYGRLLKGPSEKPLAYYHTELKDGAVMVTVYGTSDAVPSNSIPPALDSTKTKPLFKADSTATDSTGGKF